jgi:FHA domain
VKISEATLAYCYRSLQWSFAMPLKYLYYRTSPMLVLKIQENGKTTHSILVDWEGDRTFGRNAAEPHRHYKIGESLGETGKTISRVHATIRSTRLGDKYEIQIHDGTEHSPSSSGVWIREQRITGWTTIEPGTEVELLKGYVLMLLQDQETDPGGDRTYSQDDLVGALGDQIAEIRGQNQILGAQIQELSQMVRQIAAGHEQFAQQLTARQTLDDRKEQTDKQQQEELALQRENLSKQKQDAETILAKQQQVIERHNLEIRRLYAGMRSFVAASFAIAGITILTSGLLQIEQGDRKELKDWAQTVGLPLILGVGALYLKNVNEKDKP